MVYVSRGLQNIQSMTVGRERDAHWNQFWHWVKHARPILVQGGVVGPAEIRGVPSEEAYLAFASEICRAAARGAQGTDVKVREVNREGGLFWSEWLIWYQPRGLREGLFLAVKVVGVQGELKTMFSPEEGRAYFDEQGGEIVH